MAVERVYGTSVRRSLFIILIVQKTDSIQSNLRGLQFQNMNEIKVWLSFGSTRYLEGFYTFTTDNAKTGYTGV